YLDEMQSDIHEELIRDRRQLAHTGVVVASLVMDRGNGKILEGPHFDVRDVNLDLSLGTLEEELVTRFRDLSLEARADDLEVEKEFRQVTRRFFRKNTGSKPVVIPLVYKI